MSSDRICETQYLVLKKTKIRSHNNDVRSIWRPTSTYLPVWQLPKKLAAIPNSITTGCPSYISFWRHANIRTEPRISVLCPVVVNGYYSSHPMSKPSRPLDLQQYLGRPTMPNILAGSRFKIDFEITCLSSMSQKGI